MGGVEVKGKGSMQTFMWVPPPDFHVSPINHAIFNPSNSSGLLSVVKAAMGPAKAAVSLFGSSSQSLCRISHGVVPGLRHAGSSGLNHISSKGSLSNLLAQNSRQKNTAEASGP